MFFRFLCAVAIKKRILYAVLNWGLGHATRSIPVIDYLLQKNYFVVIAADGEALVFLQENYAHNPQIKFEVLPAYNPVYHPAGGSFAMAILLQLPKFVAAIYKENQTVASLIKKWEIDTIISDNRYGCFLKKIPSYLITHQLNVQLPLQLKIGFDRMLNFQLRKFTAILVPDFPDRELSGKLSESNLPRVFYMGPLSRLEKNEKPKKYKAVCLLSGPEPQRSILEAILKKAIDFSQDNLLVRGTLTKDKSPVKNAIDMADTAQINELLNTAEIVVCRSGYTTLMDLAKIHHKKIICIPTPGQTEQEYLAKKLAMENKVVMMEQANFNWAEALKKTEEVSGFDENWTTDYFMDTMIKIGL